MTRSLQGKEVGPARSGADLRLLRRISPYSGVLPFTLLVLLFLFWPTYSVVTGAFRNAHGGFTFAYILSVFTDPQHLSAFKRSTQVSAITAIAGAVLGALLAWAVATGKPNGFLRRFTLSASGVLAQFGGVMLAFAFLATFGFNGMVTSLLASHFPHTFLADPNWLYGLTGLSMVYTFFQIPLMFLVFLPSIENLKPQWREASESLGGTTSEYWRNIGLPILAPSFLGATLLLFANAFSAYATAAALISQGSSIVPLQISDALSSEVTNQNAALAKALALGMVLVVGVIMTLYTLLRRRVSKWEQ